MTIPTITDNNVVSYRANNLTDAISRYFSCSLNKGVRVVLEHLMVTRGSRAVTKRDSIYLNVRSLKSSS